MHHTLIIPSSYPIYPIKNLLVGDNFASGIFRNHSVTTLMFTVGGFVLSGRPIVAVVLHIVHIGAVAVARSRQEANLAFLGLNVAGRIPQQTSGNGFLLYIPQMGEMLDLLIFTL